MYALLFTQFHAREYRINRGRNFVIEEANATCCDEDEKVSERWKIANFLEQLFPSAIFNQFTHHQTPSLNNSRLSFLNVLEYTEYRSTRKKIPRIHSTVLQINSMTVAWSSTG